MAFKTSSLQAGAENFTSSLGKFNTTLIHFPDTCGVESKNQTPVWANCNRRSTRFCVSTSLLNYLAGSYGPIWKSCVIIPWTTVRRGSLTGLMVMNTIMWNRLRQWSCRVFLAFVFPVAREWEQSLAGTRDYVTDLNSKFHQNGKVERACCIMAVPSATCGAAKSSTREFTRRPRPNYSSEQVNLRAPEKFWRQARCQKLLWRVWTLTSGAPCDYVGVNIHR